MSEIKVDTVAEKTSANGVTVDGLNIKDSKLVTANSVITSNITDANITTAKILDDNVTYAKIQNVSATDRILGRDSSGAGVIEEITPANLRTMLNVADGANVGGGKVLQVLTDTTTTQVEISGTSQTATGLSIAITPSATSSKIAIFANISSILKSGGDTNVNLNLTRGGSGISNFGAALADTGNSNYQSVAGQGVAYLDSPNTTSETTYAVTFGKGNSNGIARVQQSSGMSTMIIMEIGA